MKAGDRVLPRPKWVVDTEDYGVGIVLDVFENEDGSVYVEGQWGHEVQWWQDYELFLLSAS